MADDIDIEEHDVLDNPLLKNIFPDITSIKTEVIDYEDEENDEENMLFNGDEDFSYEIQQQKNDPSIHESKPSSSSTSGVNTPEPHATISRGESHSDGTSHHCNECDSMFPTEEALDEHKTITHSYLVAVRKNKAYKSTTKGSIFNRKIKMEPDPVEDKSVLCSCCNEVFPDELAFMKHSYSVMPVCFQCDLCDMECDSEAALRNHKATHSMNDEYICCPVCSCHFRNRVKLCNHMRIFHGFNDDVPEPTTAVDFDCEACGHSLPDCKRYNHHIQHKHPELYNKVVDTRKYHCPPCNLTFPSSYSEKIHRAAKHAVPDDVSYEQQSTSSQNYLPMPIATLFKCTKCHVHFLSFMKAVEHFKTCEADAGDYKCKICRRFLNKPDKIGHLKQHEMVEKLKGIKIRDVEIQNKIVCNCRKCQICFDEAGFQKCHTDVCLPAKSVKCSLCRLIIHEDYMVQHSKAHATGVKTTDFIVVDYMCFDENEQKEQIQEQPKVKMDRTAKPKHLFYCPTCKCYLKINRTIHGHSVGKCNRSLNKYLCKLCGLCFTVKGMKTHKREHKLYPNLKLHEFKFVSTQTGRQIEPKFPEFKKCKACSVHFFSEQARRRHSCFSEVHKTCQYCRENFSDLAFKLHVPFHKYGDWDSQKVNIPDILKTYESLQTMWNILYLCETCDTIIDTYDSVVEHSQDHFCNMESYNKTINNCDICDLKFVGNSIDRHKELHLGNSLRKDSFIILNYDYEKLLSNEWLKMFACLAKEQVNQILSRSIYKVTRSIRMEIAVDGPLHTTLYRCGGCSNIIDTDCVEAHAQNNNCSNNDFKYNCVTCRLSFATRNSKADHDYLHKTCKLDSNCLRIIDFNLQKDFYVNDVLRSKLRPEGLSFKRCQQCGKLIQKDKFQKHSAFHVEQKHKLFKNQPKFVSKSSAKKMVHTFYTCRKCKVSVVFKQTINIHTCKTLVRLVKCNKCGLMIRASSLQRHSQYHRKFPKMTAADIKIVYFQNKCIEDPVRQNEEQLVFYQCTDCALTVHRESTTKKHACNGSLNKKYCNICELYFHASNFMHHEKIHEQMAFGKDDITLLQFRNGVVYGDVNPQTKIVSYKPKRENIYIKKVRKRRLFDSQLNHELTDREFYRSISARLYKCDTCKLLFVTGSCLAQHQKICSENNTGVECKNCGLIFHETAIKHHITLQKCNLKPNINFISLKLNCETYSDRRVVYLCQQCNVYNISLRGNMYHVEANHRIGKMTVKCVTCNITFSSVSYRNHMKLHHHKKRTGFKDLAVATVTIMTLADALKDLPDRSQIRLIDFDSVEESGVDGRAVKRKLSLDDEDSQDETNKLPRIEPRATTSDEILSPKSKIQFNKNSLYSCGVCDLNFLHPKTLKRHMDIGRHDEQRYVCPECNLMFTRISLTRHMYTHETVEETNDYRPKYRNESRTRRSQGDSSEENSQSSSTYKVEIEPSISTEEASQGDPEVKLYKCAACDVYYLKEDICVEHVTEHAALDPTEYIACKMCDLQFLCEYLGSHMKTHRDKSFNIDKLIVLEYQIVDNSVKIDTYSAADRLKSKLVSTTTHSDTEDEKNDNIDSTTDENNFNQSAPSVSDQSADRPTPQMESAN
ncbi:zinc finger protein 91-like [Danaus plexippus]|uniref:zinc finger protein 91-like n=1 Tax=Danaus plexippus TaxID=13037 RepID=UPI002AAF4B75|nr:zinc finger protein 91-like [Danaus plexippus]XP_032528177.2 zinc finger protein 91-like [Danaus plexippus]XP_061381741.1 zinc finger protein 91-like [Danaus plexippus]XP_061381742.1 zinc finger protein 91-like [Danaus plexippus]